MPAPIHVKIINIVHDLSKIADLMKYKDNKAAYKYVLDLESCLDDLKAQKVTRKMRLILNKFEKEFKLIKVALFFREELEYGIEKVLTWANILQHRTRLADSRRPKPMASDEAPSKRAA